MVVFFISAVKQRENQSKSVSLVLYLAPATAAETDEVILLKTLILQVICLYQKVVPHLVNQCKFDFSKLLKGNVPSVE